MSAEEKNDSTAAESAAAGELEVMGLQKSTNELAMSVFILATNDLIQVMGRVYCWFLKDHLTYGHQKLNHCVVLFI